MEKNETNDGFSKPKTDGFEHITVSAGGDAKRAQRLIEEAVELCANRGYKDIYITIDKKNGQITVEGKPEKEVKAQ